MKRVMLDLETYSAASNACILSIGACFFDEEKIGAMFYQPLQCHNQVTSFGRHISANTMKWWSEQSEEARQVFNDPNAVELQHGLQAFRDWVGDSNPEMWGNGADFDCVILGNAFEAVGIQKPWSYSNNRCFRTLKNIVKLRPGFGLPARVGTHHNALDDAIYQAQCAQVYLRELKR
jgi:hypothetical protein